MILDTIFDNAANIPDIGQYHVETAIVKSDDLAKKILRVKSDHNREYGIRLSDDSMHLENGSAFVLGDHQLLVIQVIPDEIIIVSPKGIDEMGQTAYMLGNLHKPLQIKDGRITLLYDSVVVSELKKKNISFVVEKKELDNPFEYADLSYGHHHSHHDDQHDND
jgi:urease accessory protein